MYDSNHDFLYTAPPGEDDRPDPAAAWDDHGESVDVSDATPVEGRANWAGTAASDD